MLRASSADTFNLSGKVDISGNTNGSDSCNVELGYSKVITVQDKLENTKPIGVTADKGVDITSGFKTKMPDADPADFFKSDISGWGVLWNDAKTEAIMLPAMLVTFHSNMSSDPEMTKKQYVVPETPTELRANPFTWPLHIFMGWNTKADGSGTKYADKGEVTLDRDQNLELFAQWEQIEVEVEAFDSKGYPYTGKAVEPEVKAKVKQTGKALVEGTDFTVKYTNNVNAGEGQAVITFIGDYDGIAAKTQKFKITPKPITVTAEDKTKVQDEADPELTYTVEGLVGSDKLEGKLEREEGEDPGEYKITQGTLSAGTNYSITFVGAIFAAAAANFAYIFGTIMS